jgi:CheY-like chemotaxis protein
MAPKLLIVDGSDTDRATLTTLLADTGFELDDAPDGIEAFEKLLALSYDLVVTEAKLDHLDGPDLIANLRARAASRRFAPNQDGRTNAIPAFVYAGWLTGAVPWDTGVQQQLAAVGITSDYYPEVLRADPLATGTISDPAQDPDRYDFIGSHPYLPLLHAGDPPNPQMYAESQSTTMTVTNEKSHDYSVGLTVEGEFTFLGLINTSLSVDGTLKWTNSSSRKETKGAGTTDTLTIGQPAFG